VGNLYYYQIPDSLHTVGLAHYQLLQFEIIVTAHLQTHVRQL